MSSLVDVVLFNPVAAGTADFVVSAARLGYLTPAAAAAVNGATYSYRAESADLAQWEVGRGVWNAGSDTLTRAVVLYNSLGNTAKINFTLVPQVGLVALATDVAALDGIAHYTNTTEATGVGTTYAARFEGGVEFAKKVFITGGVIVSGNGITLAAHYQTVLANCYYDGAWKYLGNGLAWGMGNNFSGGSSATTIAVAATNASGANAALSWNPVLDIAPTQAKVIPNTASTTTTTGALIVGGGVGVGGALNVAGVSSAAGLSSSSYVRAADGASIGWGALSATIVGDSSADVFVFYTASTERMRVANTQISISPTTASSSTTTGALVVGGGVGVAGALNIGGAFNAVGTVNQMGFFGSSQSLAYLTVAGSAGNILFGASGTTAFLQNSFGTAIIEMQASGSAVTADVRGGGFTATSPSLGVGYRTGAGSTGTQATNKSTTVVPSKNCNCGQITMNAAALAAATIVSFSFTDTSVVATDVIVINHVSGGTLGAYTVNARAAAGSFTVDVRNNTGGSLSEALVLQFAVVKSVNA